MIEEAQKIVDSSSLTLIEAKEALLEHARVEQANNQTTTALSNAQVLLDAILDDVDRVLRRRESVEQRCALRGTPELFENVWARLEADAVDAKCKEASFARRSNRALKAAERQEIERLFKQGLNDKKWTVTSALDEIIELPIEKVFGICFFCTKKNIYIYILLIKKQIKKCSIYMKLLELEKNQKKLQLKHWQHCVLLM